MKSVAVLISTYNGEKYLREQLDSILNQIEVEIELFVRDDGSSDNTKTILSEYAEKHNNIHLNFAENVGVGNSFMNLLYSVPHKFDFYAFADQDDIWLENKLFEAVKLLGESGKLLYASNMECVDKYGVSLGLRWKTNDKRIFTSPEGIISANVLCGCTMLMVKSFVKLICEESNRPSEIILRLKNHDGWIAAVAAVYDGLIFDNRSFIKYRQHGENVVGAYKANFKQRLKQRKNKLFNKNLRCPRSRQSREICEKFPERAAKFPLLQISANTKSCKDKKVIIRHQAEFRKFTDESKFGFILKVRLGLF